MLLGAICGFQLLVPLRFPQDPDGRIHVAAIFDEIGLHMGMAVEQKGKALYYAQVVV